MILTIWKYKHIPLQSIQNMGIIKNMAPWQMSRNSWRHMDLSDVGKTALSLWRRSIVFATTPFIWPIISSFTWASVMHRRFWQHLHAAVFQDSTHFLCYFWCKLQAYFMKYLELAQNWHSLARFCDWSVYLHMLKWYWLEFSLFTAPLQGAVFFTLAHGSDCQRQSFRNCNP